VTLLARRREELKRERNPREPEEKHRSLAVRPPQPHPSFLHVQAALGNRATGSLLRSAAVLPKQGDGPIAQELSPVVQIARLLPTLEAARVPPGFLVPDGTVPGIGQMTRSGFLAAMCDAAREAAEQGFAGTGHTARGCPWIEHYFHFYQRQSAERIEADLLRYVPAADGATSADELLALASEHVRASVGHWSATGELTGLPRGLPGAGLVTALAGSLAGVQAQLGEGRPLDSSARSRMERAFGTRFAAVRLHTGAAAARLARRFHARAFAIGPHVAFDRGEYRPGTLVGDALLAHELAHVGQQAGATRTAAADRSPALERNADRVAAGVMARLWAGATRLRNLAPTVRPRLAGGLQLARCPKKKPKPATLAVKIDTVEDATRFLASMADEIKAVVDGVRGMLVKAENRKALQVLNQEKVGRWLKNASSLYEEQTRLIGADLAQQAPLRAAYVRVLDEVRKAASTALAASEGLDAATVTREKAAYAENAAAWIEASPFTSAGLAAKRTFDQPDVEVAHAYEEVLGGYLDQLLEDLPKLKLSQAEKDRIDARLLAALRRAYVTVGKDSSGHADVRAIRNPEIAKKYRKVTAFLVDESRAPKLDLITSGTPIELVPFDINTIKSQLDQDPRIGQIDVSHVPPEELDFVYYGISTAEKTFFPGTTITLKNAIWPVTIPVRRGQKVIHVDYELIFDQNSNVRAERLGEARGRDVPPEFARLSVAGKKAALEQEFGLAGLDDRPAFTPPPAVPGGDPPPPARPERKWSSLELDQVKGALDLLPAGERPMLKGVALVRDFKSPTNPEKTAGVFQETPDKVLDEPVPPAHPPPHIHYYDLAFTRGKISVTGPPGANGPGVEETLLHEIGHLRIGQLHIQANVASDAADKKVADASAAIGQAVKGVLLSQPKVNAWTAWLEAVKKVSPAFTEYVAAVNDFSAKSNEAQTTPKPFPDPATLQPKQAAAEAALQASADKRKQLDKVGIPLKMRKAAADFEAALGEQIKARQQLIAHDRQIPIFATLAKRFGFHPFTDYARSGGEGEWFAETYSLYVTDPDRLNTLSPRLFLWFEAGMPMDPQWEPPKEEGAGK